jgi:MYXO-CTERM domain-containing protein
MSTTTVAPIDLVFDVSDIDNSDQLYRVFGKFSNKTPGRLDGFKVELGFGVGADFVASTDLDGLSLAEASEFGRYPGGLFGGSPAEGLPFFNVESAEFTLAKTEDAFEGTDMPTQYSDLFGNWLPLEWVPTAWFHDHDGNPANDPLLQAWFDGERWLTYEKQFDLDAIDALFATLAGPPVLDRNGDILAQIEAEVDFTDRAQRDAVIAAMTLVEQEIPQAQLDAWAGQPTTVETAGGDLYATWDPELGDEGLYVLASDGTTRTLDEMTALIIADGLVRVDGYLQDVIEDLANVNTNYAVRVARTAVDTPLQWPTCADQGAGNACQFTLRITPAAAVDADDAPVWVPVEPVRSSGGGCSTGGQGGFDPLLPGIALLGLGYLALRRRSARTQ